MSFESQSLNRKDFLTDIPQQQFMETQAEVLWQVFGKDDAGCANWLDDGPKHGAYLRELLYGCYDREKNTFSDECVAQVVDTLRHDLEEEESVH